MLNKDKIYIYIDRVIMVFLCFVIFCLPFSKAGIESFIWPAIFIWLIKRVLGFKFKAGSLWGMLSKTQLNRALGVFFVINVLSVIFSTNFGLSLRGLMGKELKFIMLYFMLIEVVNSKKRLRIILITIVASALLMISDAGVQFFRGVDFLRGYAWRYLSASFFAPNGFAAWLVVIIPLFSGLLLMNRRMSKSFKALLIIIDILLVVCLLATYARGAWLGLAIGISFMAWCIINTFDFRKKRLCLFVGVGILAVFFVLPQPLKSKVGSMGKINFRSGGTIDSRIKSMFKAEEGSSIMFRFKVWNEALKIIRDYPWFGCGLNTYSIVARRYKSFEGGGVYPHNSYLQKSAETGLLGLTAFILILLTLFKVGLRYFNQKKDYLVLGALSGILAFLVHSFFDNHLYSLQLVVLFWYMLGLTVAMIRLEPNINHASRI